MDPGAKVAAISVFTYVLNLPFGYWRARTKRFSVEWFLAVHLPVPFIVAARVWLHAPWVFIPVFVLAFFLGQYTGGCFRSREKR